MDTKDTATPSPPTITSGGALKIEASIKPYLLEEVKAALSDLGIVGLTVSEVRDFGTGTDVVPFEPRLKLEIVVPGTLAAPAMEQIFAAGQISTPHQVRIQRLTDVIRIRTSERGALAI